METNKTPYQLYPEIEPYKNGMLKVSDLHTIYYEESGNPNGKPIVFLHGGPGLDPEPAFRQFFDPNHYRIILFDQRGTRYSTPVGELRENNTPRLVSDMERLRKHLGVESWIITGWSWGSFLALYYSICFPEYVEGLIVQGTFLGRKSDIDFGSDNEPPSVIEKHFFENRCFLRHDNEILENVHQIHSIPIVIIHGDEDTLCPLSASLELKDALPNCTLRTVKGAGHWCTEPAIASEIVNITDHFRSL